MDAIETIKAKRAEYQKQLEQAQADVYALQGAIAAADDILSALEVANEKGGQNGE